MQKMFDQLASILVILAKLFFLSLIAPALGKIGTGVSSVILHA